MAAVFLGSTGRTQSCGGRGAPGLEPPVAGGAKDLGPSELKELEVAPERAAAELPEAQVPLAGPPGQLVGVAAPQRLQEHERLPLPRAIVARLRFSDLYCTDALIPWSGYLLRCSRAKRCHLTPWR
jgi:hypothetical protein